MILMGEIEGKIIARILDVGTDQLIEVSGVTYVVSVVGDPERAGLIGNHTRANHGNRAAAEEIRACLVRYIGQGNKPPQSYELSARAEEQQTK
jgi:hypothetical protein